MEKIKKKEHIIGDYIIEEVEECVYKEPDLWVGKIGEEGRIYIGTNWYDAVRAIEQR